MKDREKIGSLWLLKEDRYPSELHVVVARDLENMGTFVLFYDGTAGWWRFSQEYMSRISVRFA